MGEKVSIRCSACGGSGVWLGSREANPIDCARCGGSGHERVEPDAEVVIECDGCDDGYVEGEDGEEQVCGSCRGAGVHTVQAGVAAAVGERDEARAGRDELRRLLSNAAPVAWVAEEDGAAAAAWEAEVAPHVYPSRGEADHG